MLDLYSVLTDKAAIICVNAHYGQRDKSGQPYFMHPMRVAMRCNTPQERITALLHDTIEDTDITPQQLLDAGFPEEIVEAVLSVTRRESESYSEFVERAKANAIGRQVKMHDIEDNLDALRLDRFDAAMAERYNRYLQAYHYLKN